MMVEAATAATGGARTPIEMTADPRFTKRVIRLAGTSAVALGLIWGFQVATLNTHVSIGFSLLAGWLLMPTLLTLSLRWPSVRYGLVLPSALVSIGLISTCLTALPAAWGVLNTGWLMITVGILMGGGQGIWFWLRLAPVPGSLHDPFSWGRWTLVGIHVALIVAGLLIVGTAL